MELDPIAISKAYRTLKQAQSILIMIQVNPDPDSTGAALAFREALEAQGKRVVCAAIDPIPDVFQFMHGAHTIVHEIDPIDQFDLIMAVDCGDSHMTGFIRTHPELFDGRPFINIDHHKSNDRFGTINIVEPLVSSTGELVYHVFKELGYPITPSIATCLLAGIYADTGSFQHSNTSVSALRVSSRLLERGANYAMIVKHLFKHMPLSQLKAWGLGLKTLNFNDKQIVSSVIRERDLERVGSNHAELSGLVSLLDTIPKRRFTMLLVEKGENVKGSLRTTRDDVDVAKVAMSFGGGGHKKAAGFSIPKSELKQDDKQRWQVVSKDVLEPLMPQA